MPAATTTAVARKPRGHHHHGALRRALLDAVAELVLEGGGGPEAVSLRECARRAGVSHSAAAPHFGDKRGLLTAFAAEGSERLRAAMEAEVAAEPDPSPAARLAATGRGYLAFAAANPGHFRIMFRADLLDADDAALRVAREASFAPLLRAMRALHPGAPDAALRDRLALAWSAVHGLATLRAEGAGAGLLADPEVPEGLLALVVAACAAPVPGSGVPPATAPATPPTPPSQR
jgi:AcrR family transcriptional regulator